MTQKSQEYIVRPESKEASTDHRGPVKGANTEGCLQAKYGMSKQEGEGH